MAVFKRNGELKKSTEEHVEKLNEEIENTEKYLESLKKEKDLLVKKLNN